MSTPQTETFAQSYAQLQKSVQRLRSTEVSNIDDLIGIVDNAMEAYRHCSSRLETIQKLTGEKLGDMGPSPDESEDE